MRYNKPPLPFMGNKRNMLKHIKKVLEIMREDGQIDSETIFIDCFGGSGLISHNIKQWYPSNRVIWNDYDNYQERLNHIDTTEQIRQEIAKILQERELKALRNDKLHPHTKEAILTLLQEQSDAFIDYITISSWLLFSGSYTTTLQELVKQSFYYRTPTVEPLQSTAGYLAGVERTQADFIELLDSYKDITNKCLILDPPYLQTQVGNYRASFQLGQFFALIERVQKPYLFFGSHRSDILPAFEYFSKYHKELENHTYQQAGLLLNDTDYIIYPHPRSLLIPH